MHIITKADFRDDDWKKVDDFRRVLNHLADGHKVFRAMSAGAHQAFYRMARGYWEEFTIHPASDLCCVVSKNAMASEHWDRIDRFREVLNHLAEGGQVVMSYGLPTLVLHNMKLGWWSDFHIMPKITVRDNERGVAKTKATSDITWHSFFPQEQAQLMAQAVDNPRIRKFVDHLVDGGTVRVEGEHGARDVARGNWRNAVVVPRVDHAPVGITVYGLARRSPTHVGRYVVGVGPINSIEWKFAHWDGQVFIGVGEVRFWLALDEQLVGD